MQRLLPYFTFQKIPLQMSHLNSTKIRQVKNPEKNVFVSHLPFHPLAFPTQSVAGV